jgi:hypothetical protein
MIVAISTPSAITASLTVEWREFATVPHDGANVVSNFPDGLAADSAIMAVPETGLANDAQG